MYDAVIIGGGAVGCAVARELSRWQVKICLAEQGEDVCVGTSKANSAIVHAGFDAPAGSMKARFNVEGSRRMEALSRELDFPDRAGSSSWSLPPRRISRPSTPLARPRCRSSSSRGRPASSKHTTRAPLRR